MTKPLTIREATEQDWQAVWPFFQDIVKRADTYGIDPEISKGAARTLWCELPEKSFVALTGNQIAGTYYLKTNHAGPGNHVCNCGYMVDADYRGQGLASSMCEHSQKIAKRLGYRAMQFNFVASSNIGAIRLWEKLGFSIQARLPDAFQHPRLGLIDALVMYKWL